VDWRQQRELNCNAGLNPQADRMNDGLPLDPFEVLFIKAKAFPQVPAAAVFLERYTDYFLRDAKAIDTAALEGNGFLAPAVQRELQREKAALWRKAQRCGAAFDTAFYLARNPDLQGVVPGDAAQAHFEDHGFNERREYRFVAPAPAVGGSGSGGGAGEEAAGPAAVVRRGEEKDGKEDCDFD
jgi:hypothetical protein